MSSYLHGKILGERTSTSGLSTSQLAFKPDTIFNLALVWTLIFLCLHRGLHGAGRLLVVLAALPLALYLMVSFRFIESFGAGVERLFEATDKPFLLDGTVS